MNPDRIREIQETTAYPESISVTLALEQVWNECEQEKVKNLTIPDVSDLSHPSNERIAEQANEYAKIYLSDQVDLNKKRAFEAGVKWILLINGDVR